MILLTHNIVELDQIARAIGIGGYAAMMRFHALASGSKNGNIPLN